MLLHLVVCCCILLSCACLIALNMMIICLAETWCENIHDTIAKTTVVYLLCSMVYFDQHLYSSLQNFALWVIVREQGGGTMK